MAKSGVEYLAQHPGWKTRKRKRKGKGNKLSDTLRSAASALDHGRHSTAEKKLREVVYRYSDGSTFTDNLTLAEARKFKKLQGGGKISPMPKAKVEHLDESDVATILAALRLFQEEYENKDAIQIADAWPNHFNVRSPGGEVGGQDVSDGLDVVPMPLGTADISALCERINCAKCLVLP